MEKWLSGLSLLTLLILTSGQGAFAQALTEPLASDPDAIDEPDTEANSQDAISSETDNADETNPEAAEAEEQRAIASETEVTDEMGTQPVELLSSSPSLPISLTPHLPHSESPPTTTTVTEWLAQIEAALVQIIDLQVEFTEAGLQVVIEADGELATSTQSTSGNALVLTISNATLAEEFQVFEPAEGIALVQATALPGNVVQVAITGNDAVPDININIEATGLVLEVTPGIAQVVTEDDAIQIGVTGEEGSRYVEPNTATATRTDTPLRDIPQSIQVIPREVLEDQQVITLGDALRNVSGVVRSEQTFAGERFIIRGFNSASILRDGFRVNRGAFSVVDFPELANLETVEVLKGPASILVGSIEPGGVINLVSKQPLSEPFYDLELQVGNRGLISPSLDFSGPLTEDGRLLYRLNALVRREDSFRDFDTDIRRSFIAPTISWQISDRTDLNVQLEYRDEERPADSGLVAIGDEVADIPFDRVIGELDDMARDEFLRVAYNFEHRFSDRWRLRNAFSYRWRTRVSENTAILGPSNETAGDFSVVYFAQRLPEEVLGLQTNIVGEFNTGTVEHTLLFGVDLLRDRIRNGSNEGRLGLFSPIAFNIFEPVYGTLPRPDVEALPLFTSVETRTDGLGIYLQNQVTLLDNLKLLAGIRYETVDQETINNPTDLNPNSSESTLNEDAFTPRVGLVYQPIEELSLYSSYTTSFVPNTATTEDGELLEPERGEQFEIGARAELLDGRLTANLAFFDITKENVATTDPDNFLFSVASGEQRSRGIELDIAGEILPGWNLIANYAYTDAEITEDEDGNEDNRLIGVPEHNFNLWTTYDIQDGPLEGLGFGLGFNYVSERFGDTANSFTADGYFLTNAAVSYERDNWRTAINIRNLFDVDYIESAGRNRTFGINPGEPFTLIGSFTIEF